MLLSGYNSSHFCQLWLYMLTFYTGWRDDQWDPYSFQGRPGWALLDGLPDTTSSQGQGACGVTYKILNPLNQWFFFCTLTQFLTCQLGHNPLSTIGLNFHYDETFSALCNLRQSMPIAQMIKCASICGLVFLVLKRLCFQLCLVTVSELGLKITAFILR